MGKSVAGDRWQARRSWAWSLRMATVLVPVVAGVAAIALLSRLVPKPGGLAEIGWYLLVFGGSWAVLWATQRLLTRLLPLAVLLEMSLVFPERAPSRFRVARRAGSASELNKMAQAPTVGRADETIQQAAERILTLVAALARHDKRTRGHAERVRSFTDLIADRMGLPQADRDLLRWASLLHDIGKLEVPSTLLNKAGKPTSDEWETLRAHPAAGAKIAEPLLEWLGVWGAVIIEHHEKFDGTGYPTGLAGHDISLGARIVAVADTFEVMTAARSYKRPVRKELALKELVRCAGTQFDPEVVRALVAIPAKRMMVVMGPSAWIAGIPFLGQAPAALGATMTAQAGATIGMVTMVSVASMSPQAAASSSSISSAPVAPVSTTQPQLSPSPSTHAPAHTVVKQGPSSTTDLLSRKVTPVHKATHVTAPTPVATPTHAASTHAASPTALPSPVATPPVKEVPAVKALPTSDAPTPTPTPDGDKDSHDKKPPTHDAAPTPTPTPKPTPKPRPAPAKKSIPSQDKTTKGVTTPARGLPRLLVHHSTKPHLTVKREHPKP
jgi:putative nucleotidyltransferase with HDIG domain